MNETNGYKLVAIGECLIDFVPLQNQEKGTLGFRGCPGGAPANVLACAAKLGLRTAFISKVGNDVFGKLLHDTFNECGIYTGGLILSDEHPTTLAFVALDESGDRSFSFYRNQTADCTMTSDEIDHDLLRAAHMFHFGAVSMTTEPARSTTLYAVQAAKASGALISYDPNLRELLWNDLDEAKAVITDALQYADIVKLSDEELVFLTGVHDLEEAMRLLYAAHSIQMLVVTLGSDGCACIYNQDTNIIRMPGFRVDTVDTVGAGDTFWGSFLYHILTGRLDPAYPNPESLAAALAFANAAGALSTTKNGAIPAMPDLGEITALLIEK